MCRNNRYNANPNNKEGWWDGLRVQPSTKSKDVISLDSRIRRGLGRETRIVFFKILFSWRCSELNSINIYLNSFSDHEKLGVEGKGLSIFDGDDVFCLLNKNNRNIINK